ncbi:hypothetical protein E2C01_047786 [Portunus trituberculatus]|uniref:Uncharacterized protein n=1 Tax=Portunus trituberculatus TaxID=210409 RepID=A0A5B7G9F8_PORTR|nr:hypothetical protein [Portunus trituberculatus]
MTFLLKEMVHFSDGTIQREDQARSLDKSGLQEHQKEGQKVSHRNNLMLWDVILLTWLVKITKKNCCFIVLRDAVWVEHRDTHDNRPSASQSSLAFPVVSYHGTPI